MKEGRKRRSPYYPESRGEKVTGTPRQLLALDILQDFDVLLGSHWKALYPTPEYLEDIITLLNNEGYIGVPEEGRHVENRRSRVTPYELRPKGITLLKEAGMYKGRTKGTDPYRHKYLNDAVKSSFLIACEQVPGLELVTEAQILANPNCDPKIRTQPNPSYIKIDKHLIKPDARIFGLKYTDPGRGTAFMFFHGWEGDRATETGTSEMPKNRRKTVTSTIRAYSQYLEEDLAYERYGITKISLPWYTINQGRALTILDIIKREAPAELTKNFIVMQMPDAKSDVLPKPEGTVVTENYLRYFYDNVKRTHTLEEFNILETLKATARRKHDTGAKNRSGEGTHREQREDRPGA